MSLVFHAATYDNQTFECLELPVGTGPATYTTDAALYLPDFEGIYRAPGAGNAPWYGSRVVDNYATETVGPLEGAGWQGTNAGLRVGTVAGIGPNGEDVAEIDLTDSNVTRWVQQGHQTNSEEIVLSIWVRTVSGTDKVRLVIQGGNSPDIDIDENWTRITFDGGVDGGNRTGLQGAFAGTTGNIYACNPQIERPVGATNQAPSEFIGTGSAGAPTADPAVTKHFANINGNTVDGSNVVTEAVGAQLDPLPSLYAAPEATNLYRQSNNLTVGPWTGEGSLPTITFDQEGLTGEPNTASLVDDVSASFLQGVRQSLSGVSANNSPITFRVWIKKDTDQTRFPQFATQLSGATTRDYFINFDTQTGATAERGTVPTGYSHEVIDDGNWWILQIEVADKELNTTVRTVIYPAATASGLDTPSEVAATGSIIIGNVEFHDGVSSAQVKGAGPIFTAGAGVTVAVSEINAPIANWLGNTENCIYYQGTLLGPLDWAASNLQTGLYAGASSGTYGHILRHDLDIAANLRQTCRGTGGGNFNLFTGTDGERRYKWAFVYSATEVKADVNGDGVWAGENLFFQDLQTGIAGQLRLAGFPQQPILINNVRAYDDAYDAGRTIIEELMLIEDGGFPEAPAVTTDNRPDAKNAALGGGNTDTEEQAFLKANGATSDNVNTAWRQFLDARGFTTGNYNTDMFAYLGSKGYTGALSDRLKQWWDAGAPP